MIKKLADYLGLASLSTKKDRLVCSLNRLFVTTFMVGLTGIAAAELVEVPTGEKVTGDTSVEGWNITEGGKLDFSSDNANLAGKTIQVTPEESSEDLVYAVIGVGSGNATPFTLTNAVLTGSGKLAFMGKMGSGSARQGITLNVSETSTFKGTIYSVNAWDNATDTFLGGTQLSEVAFAFAADYMATGDANSANPKHGGLTKSGTNTDTLQLTGDATLTGVIFPVTSGVTATVRSSSTTMQTLTLAGDKNCTYAGTFGTTANPLSLVRTGTGTQTLSGATALTNLTLTSGSLVLNGETSVSGALTVTATEGTHVLTLGNTLTLGANASLAIQDATIEDVASYDFSQKHYTLFTGTGTLVATTNVPCSVNGINVGYVSITTTGELTFGKIYTVTLTGDTQTYSTITWPDGVVPGELDVAKLVFEKDCALTFDTNPSAAGVTLEGADKSVTLKKEESITVASKISAVGVAAVALDGSYTPTFATYPAILRYINPTGAYTTTTKYATDLAGDSTTATTLNLAGGKLILSAGTQTALSIPCNATQTEIAVSGGDLTFPAQFSFGTVTATISGGTIRTPLMVTVQGGNSRSSTITQTGGDILVSGTGDGSAVDSTAIMLGHWRNSTSVYTLSGGRVIAEKGGLRLGNDSSSTLNVAGGTLQVKGIKGKGEQTSALNLSAGVVSLGANGFANIGALTATVSGGELNAYETNTIAQTLNVTGATTLSAAADKAMTVNTLTGAGALTIGTTAHAGTVKFGTNAFGAHTGSLTVAAGTADLQNTTLASDSPKAIAMQGGTLILDDGSVAVNFTELSGGNVVLLTTASSLNFTVPEGTTTCATTFTVNGMTCTPTFVGTTMTLTAEVATVPYTATVTENSNFSALVWKGTNGAIAPLSAVIAETETSSILTTEGATAPVTVTMDTTPSTLAKLTITASDVAPLTLAKTGSNKLVVTKVLLTSNLTVNDGVATFTAIDIANGKTITLANNSDMTLPTLSGAGTYTKTGTGTLKVSTTNKVEPEIIVSGGTLEFGGLTFGEAYKIRAKTGAKVQVGTWTGSLTSTASLFTFEAGSELRMNNGNNASGSTFAAKIVLDAQEGVVKLNGSSSGNNTVISGAISGVGTLELANDFGGNPYTISGVISGTVKVEMKDVSNVVTLSGANTSTGGMVVSAPLTAKATSIGLGDLTINSSATLTISDATNAVTIATGKSLSGTGTLTGSVNFAEGATLNASRGAMTATGTVTVPVSANVVLPETSVAGTVLIKCATPSADTALKFVLPNETTDLYVAPTEEGYALVAPPEVDVPASVETLPEGLQEEVQKVAAANGMTSVTLEGKTSLSTEAVSADTLAGMLECFTGSELTADADAETVSISYDFGISDIKVDTVTTTAVNVTAKVQGKAGATAQIVSGNTLVLEADGETIATQVTTPETMDTVTFKNVTIESVNGKKLTVKVRSGVTNN